MSIMKIGIDMDGTIIDYMKTVAAYAELFDMDVIKGSGIINRGATYAHQRYGWNDEANKKFGDEHFVELTKISPVFPLATEMIARLRADGHQVFILSNRQWFGKKHIDAAEQACADNGIVTDGFLWTDDKIRTALENELDVLIDDQAEIVRKCVEFDIPIVFFRDKNTDKVEGPTVWEVDSWPEIYRVLAKLAAESRAGVKRVAKDGAKTYLTEQSGDKPPSWKL